MTLRKIRFLQTGGFAGLVRGCELVPEALDGKERDELLRLLRGSGLAEGAAGRPTSAVRGPDRNRARDVIQYEIEIESVSGTVRLDLDDLDLPEKVAPLVAFLQRHARPVPLDRPKTRVPDPER